MAQEWYYAKDGTKHGPVTPQRLKVLAASGELRPSDLVWTEGKDEWKPARSISGLFSTEPDPPPVKAAKPVGENPVTAGGPPVGVVQQLWAKFSGLDGQSKVLLSIIGGTSLFMFLCCGSCGLLGMIGSLMDPNSQTARSNQVTSLAPTEALTEDFYPYLLGSQREMTDWISLPGGVSMNNASLVTHRANGVIEIRPLSTEGISNKGVTTLPTMGSLKQKHYRLKDGFIELGDENESFGIVWSPILKIGATPGDRWERTLQGGRREQYELKTIKVFDDISPKLVSDRKLLCAVIERKIEVEGQVGSPLYTEFVLGHGFGPVRQFVWEVENGERKDIRATAMDSFSK